MNVDPLNILKRCSSAPTIKITTASTSTQVSMTTTTITNIPNIIPTTPRSRDASPTPTMNIFAPRARRYSTGFSPLATNPGPLPRLTPRVSQLRQEECVDLASREANHEREVRSALQISQSWEDLTLDADNWSLKSDTELSNPLQVSLPNNITSCSSPSPTSRAGLRLPYVLSPSPTRRTFATRRSMSPIAMRPSSLGPVKRKVDTDDNYANMYSPPSKRKLPSETGLSPCPSPLLQICPSPDSSDDRTTPKFYISKLYTNNSSSLSSSPTTAPSPSLQSTLEMQLDLPNVNSCGSSSSSSSSSLVKPSFVMFHTPIGSDCVDGNDSNANDGENNLKVNATDEVKDSSIQDNSNRSIKFSTIDDKDNGDKSYDDINELAVENNGTEKNNMKFMIAQSEKIDNDDNN